MQKIAIVVLADSAGADGLGRIVNALTAAKEYKEAKDKVQIIFSGAGTKWISELEHSGHKVHRLYDEVRGLVTGACGFCASAFGVAEAVQSCGVSMLKEYGANMSFRRLTADGYQVITF